MQKYLPGMLVALTLYWMSAMALALESPNIVILFTDDMGYADLGSYGNPYIRTPNLDRMAGEGQRWTDFYATSSVCSPSRGALMTGKLPVKTGLYGRIQPVMHPGDPNGIPREELTLPEALQSAGYRTGMFGKWHLGDSPDHYPTRHGFDYWYGVPYSNDMNLVGAPDIDEVMGFQAEGDRNELLKFIQQRQKRLAEPNSEDWYVPLYRSRKDGEGYRDELVERPLNQPTFTRRLTAEAIDFIEEHARERFLVYVPYAMPHLPIFRSDKFAGTSLRGPYGDAVEEIDWSVGRIRETLERLDIADNTLVIFASDNGPWKSASIHDAGSGGMLRGSKGTTYEGGVRVPGIFWWPGHIQPGAVSDMGSTLDVYATVLRLAGVNVPGDSDGYDLSGTLLEKTPAPRNEMPYYQNGELMAYRKGPYKIHFIEQPNQFERKKVLDKPVLYDLRQDLSEEQDIAQSRPELLAELVSAAEAHRAKVPVKAPIFDRRFQQ